MKKFLQILLIILIIAVIVLSARFLIGGDEDTWLCLNGEWVKHGAPSAPKPTTGCGQEIKSFDDCLQAGYPALESWPRQCRTDDGQSFVEDIGNELEKTDLIRLDAPRPNQVITSPLEIHGQARGTWFFEGDFPIKLFNENDELIATSIAQAQGEWMTEGFVPFSADLVFDALADVRGTLILIKDNPSDKIELNDELRTPVKF